MSTNADDVIPASSLVAAPPPSAVDDIIPPHALTGSEDIDYAGGMGEDANLNLHQAGIIAKGAIKGITGIGTSIGDLGIGPLGLAKDIKHLIAPNAPSYGEMVNTGLEKLGFPKETQPGDTALDIAAGTVAGASLPLGGATTAVKGAEEAATLARRI